MLAIKGIQALGLLGVDPALALVGRKGLAGLVGEAVLILQADHSLDVLVYRQGSRAARATDKQGSCHCEEQRTWRHVSDRELSQRLEESCLQTEAGSYSSSIGVHPS